MITFQQKWSRRKFITNASGASAAMMLNPMGAWVFQQPDPRVAKISSRHNWH